jgi:antitoxin YefM
MNTFSLKELRPNLPKIVKDIDSKLERVMVTRHGQPTVIMMSVEDYEGLTETLNILADESGLKRLSKGLQEARKGQTISLKDFQKKVENV